MKTGTIKRLGVLAAFLGAVAVADARPAGCAGECAGSQLRDNRPRKGDVSGGFVRDGNGRLNQAERVAMRKRVLARQDSVEQPARRRLLERFDRNGDGVLNQRERATVRKARQHHHRSHEGGGGVVGSDV